MSLKKTFDDIREIKVHELFALIVNGLKNLLGLWSVLLIINLIILIFHDDLGRQIFVLLCPWLALKEGGV